MSFQFIEKVESADFYLDVAFRKAKSKVSIYKGKKLTDRSQRGKHAELIRIEVVKDQLVNRLQKILNSFPVIEDLHEFYIALVKCTLDYGELKKCLGKVQWSIKRIILLWKKYKSKIQNADTQHDYNELRSQYYGRVSSVLKRIDKNLKELDNFRKIIKKFPALKTDIRTIVIAGFPNVGKTTLLYKLTGSKAEIRSYAFTTKGLNMGYIYGSKAGKQKVRIVQLIDVPGTLNRFNKMNNIEKQAYLAIKYLADKVIYVFDPTEAYPMDQQIALYKKLKKDFPEKEIICFLSKTDLKKEAGQAYRFRPITDVKELKRVIS